MNYVELKGESVEYILFPHPEYTNIVLGHCFSNKVQIGVLLAKGVIEINGNHSYTSVEFVEVGTLGDTLIDAELLKQKYGTELIIHNFSSAVECFRRKNCLKRKKTEG